MRLSAKLCNTMGGPNTCRWMLLLLPGLVLVAAAMASVVQTPNDLASHQPLQKVAPAQLAFDQEALDALNLDDMLERATGYHTRALSLDGRITAALESGVADLPEALPPMAEERVRLLIRKAVPGPQGRQLGDLTVRFHRYQVAQRKLGLLEAAPTSRAAFEARTKLQIEHFGADDARRLFAQRNAILRAMLEPDE
ncbi:hypothetical protein [Hydrocarboniclastica marina]|uniref:Lipase chaperone n=1 Tax=Hydrocarboniclastica marina TaxID=2259620 RepID=A0A4V1D919_9ALTE|nr:hypothetical protein [Hydrocarboniclastica marina]QCF27150.1 hypothetical protein soil367_15090 [Hydrocarboniclastica marina]